MASIAIGNARFIGASEVRSIGGGGKHEIYRRQIRAFDGPAKLVKSIAKDNVW